MYKFLVQFAEMLADFAVRVHGLANNVNDVEILNEEDIVRIVHDRVPLLDEEDVARIVNDAVAEGDIELGSVGTDDVQGLERYVDEAISQYEYDDMLRDHELESMLMGVLLKKAFADGINAQVISTWREARLFRTYVDERAGAWRTDAKELEDAKVARLHKKWSVENEGQIA
jgi:hypothetical protein